MCAVTETNPPIVNFALVPELDFRAKLDAYEQQLQRELGSAFAVFTKRFPHVTVCQCTLESQDATSAWSELTRSPIQVELDFAGLTGLPSSDGSTWIEISVLTSRSLLNLQERIAGLIGPHNVKNDIGDRYRPHITLGKLATQTIPNLSLPYDLLRAKKVKTQLKIGQGIHFEDVIAE